LRGWPSAQFLLGRHPCLPSPSPAPILPKIRTALRYIRIMHSTPQPEEVKTWKHELEEYPYLVASKNAPLLEHLLRCFVAHSALSLSLSLSRASLKLQKPRSSQIFPTSHPISVTFHHLALPWRPIQGLEMQICGTCLNASGAHKWKTLSKP
jgi:hypothetical protein